MANAFKCDRCGAFYEKNNRKWNIKIGGKSSYIVSGVRIFYEYGNNLTIYDLCDDCIARLERFLNCSEEKGD